MNNPDEIDLDMDDENENDEEIEEGRLTHLQIASKFKCFLFMYKTFFFPVFFFNIN